MRSRSRVVPAQLGLALSLGLVLAAFRLPLASEPPHPRLTAPTDITPDVLLDLPPTAHAAPQPIAPPSALPPVEVPDAEVIEAVTEALPRISFDDIATRDIVPPLPPDPPEAQPPVEPPPPDEGFIEVPEIMPSLVGGLDAFQRSITYPALCRAAGIEGRVYVRFVVGTDGSVGDAEVVRGIGGGCDEAALEAVEAARFTPGYQRGRAVRVRMALPVTFRLR